MASLLKKITSGNHNDVLWPHMDDLSVSWTNYIPKNISHNANYVDYFIEEPNISEENVFALTPVAKAQEKAVVRTCLVGLDKFTNNKSLKVKIIWNFAGVTV